VQHVVLFSFPSDLDELNWAEMQRQVRAWPSEIGGMTALRLGPSINAERTRGYQYLLFTEFPDETALTTYQKHPVHQAFLAWVLERQCTPLAFDYYLDDSTVIAC
jgi:hypothetical protein